MKNMITKMSAVLVPCLFALNAHGAAVEFKPVEIKPVDVKGMDAKPADAAIVKPGQVTSPKGLTFGAMKRPEATKPVAKADSCLASLPTTLAQKSGVNEARVQELLNKGVLIAAGNCGKEVTDMSAEAVRHLVGMADYAEQNGILAAAEDQKNDIYAKGLDLSFKKDGVNLPYDSVAQRAAGVRSDCHFVQ